MKKIFFLMLMLLIGVSASMNAQVTIGADANPHAAAVLDLQSTTLGLKLPNVALTNDPANFVLTGATDKATAVGLIVYNTASVLQGKGIYSWDGAKWLHISSDTPVTSVSVTPATLSFGAANQTAQLTATVLPANATNQALTWSSSATDVATVSAAGLITAKAAGTATITVTTVDGSKTATCAVTVAMIDCPPLTDVDGNTYTTKLFRGQCWMTQNLGVTRDKDLTPLGSLSLNPGFSNVTTGGMVSVSWSSTDDKVTFVPGSASGIQATYAIDYAVKNISWSEFMKTFGLIYTYAQASKACPAGWHLPSQDEWYTLRATVGENFRNLVVNTAITARDVSTPQVWRCDSPSGFNGWPAGFSGYKFGYECSWWAQDSYRLMMQPGSEGFAIQATGFNVRCVKD
jgi:uncharacterized protein (TIGR02145 family)